MSILISCALLIACGSPQKMSPPRVQATPEPASALPTKASATVDAASDIVDVLAPKGGTVSGLVTFAEVATTTVTLRGFVSQNPEQRRAFVRPKKWLSFGGVYFPSIQTQLHVFGEHDGNIVVDAPDLAPLTLAQKNRWVETGCDDVSLEADPASTQRTELPAAFLPASSDQMILEGTEPIAISAEPNGEVAGEIHLESHSWDGAKANGRRAARCDLGSGCRMVRDGKNSGRPARSRVAHEPAPARPTSRGAGSLRSM